MGDKYIYDRLYYIYFHHHKIANALHSFYNLCYYLEEFYNIDC